MSCKESNDAAIWYYIYNRINPNTSLPKLLFSFHYWRHDMAKIYYEIVFLKKFVSIFLIEDLYEIMENYLLYFTFQEKYIEIQNTASVADMESTVGSKQSRKIMERIKSFI